VARLLLALLLPACGFAAAPPHPSIPEDAVTPSLQAVPVPPADTLLQLFCRDTGHLERVMSDGHWLVQPPGGTLAERRPESFYEPGLPRLGEDGGLRRLRETLAAVEFFDLPDRVPSLDLPPGTMLTHVHRAPLYQTYAFSAYDPEGTLHVVEGAGDLWAPETFGALEPLVVSLDREVRGLWQY